MKRYSLFIALITLTTLVLYSSTAVSAYVIKDWTGTTEEYEPFTMETDNPVYTIVTNDTEVSGIILVDEPIIVEGSLQDDTTILATEVSGIDEDVASIEEWTEASLEGTITSANPFTLDVEGTVYSVLMNSARLTGTLMEGETAQVFGYFQDETTVLALEVTTSSVNVGQGEMIEIQGTVLSCSPLTVDTGETTYTITLGGTNIIGTICEGSIAGVVGFVQGTNTIKALELILEEPVIVE